MSSTDIQSTKPFVPMERGEKRHSHGLPIAKTGSPAERFASRNPDDFAVPKGREEEWRFTPLRKLRPLFEPFADEDTVTLSTELPEGVTVTTTGTDHPLFGSALIPTDRVSALVAANIKNVVLVTIPANLIAGEPVVLRMDAQPGLNYGYVVIDAGAFSSATVILDHNGQSTVAANVETIVGDGADLTLISVQDWQAGTIHVAAHAANVGRDAKYTHMSVNLGGSIVRINPSVAFTGPGARADLFGLSFAGSGQHLESRLYVDHTVAHCTSNVVYKSALDGETARTVWIGDVRIRPEAIDTNTYELNRNLLLSDGARADSVPNLEIETGEIAGAGHASATGRFDDLQLFYLQSRGVPAEEARRLVVRGFFAEVIDHIAVPGLHDRLMAAVDARLATVAP